MAPAGLFDLAPPTEIVAINGVEHKVRGLPLRIIVELMKDYPNAVGLIGGGGLTAEAVIAQGPQVVALIIAAGYGMPDDEKARQAAADLPMDVQLDLVGAIVRATLGGGASPFAEKIKKIYDAFKIMEPPQQSDREAKLERMKQRLYRMQSPPISNSSSPEADIEPQKFGT